MANIFRTSEDPQERLSLELPAARGAQHPLGHLSLRSFCSLSHTAPPRLLEYRRSEVLELRSHKSYLRETPSMSNGSICLLCVAGKGADENTTICFFLKKDN